MAITCFFAYSKLKKQNRGGMAVDPGVGRRGDGDLGLSVGRVFLDRWRAAAVGLYFYQLIR